MNAPPISKPVLHFFRGIVRRYFRRSFHAVRVSGGQRFANAGSPLIVYANHSSWWDPMVSVLLAERLMPQRQHYAPMDAAALERYGILKRIGIFPVEMNRVRGAAQFLRTGQMVLKSGAVLWVTPQGRFVDARSRPLEFKPGLAAMAALAAPCTVVPLAIEYLFWDERAPECLLHFGDPVRIDEKETAARVEERLVEALEGAMDTLKEMAMRRDPDAFEALLAGARGPGGFYALGKRIKAMVLRRTYQPEHTLRTKDSVPGNPEAGEDHA